MNELWGYEENSTRNCIHANVVDVGRVNCSLNLLSKKLDNTIDEYCH